MKEVGEGPWVLGSLRQHAQWSFFKWSQRSRCQRGFLARHPIYTVAQAWLNPTPNTGQTTLYVLRPPVLVCGGNLVPVSGYIIIRCWGWLNPGHSDHALVWALYLVWL